MSRRPDKARPLNDFAERPSLAASASLEHASPRVLSKVSATKLSVVDVLLKLFRGVEAKSSFCKANMRLPTALQTQRSDV